MSKIGPKNPILVRLAIIIGSILFGVGIIFFAATKFIHTNALNYDLGEKKAEEPYNDIIIKSYSDYEMVIKEYDINKELKPEDFKNSYYLASFQEYDSCKETKRKQVKKVIVDEDTIEIEFERYNKCGWCKSHMVLYLIKIDQIENPEKAKINYKYTDDKTVNCGNALD